MEKTFCRKLNGVTIPKRDLLELYPPLYYSVRKQWFYDMAKKAHPLISGNMEVSRYAFNENAFEGGYTFNECCTIQTDPSYYDYKKDITDDNTFVWYVNFADYFLFAFYDDNKFAQDEIQTLEHPLLGSVVRYLEDKELPSLETETALIRNKVTSPYLLEDVPYWISVNTSVKTKDGVVHNIYGSNFIKESHDVVNEGVKLVEEEINNNIIAMSAPDDFNNDFYSFSDIKYIIQTLLTSFASAVERGKKRGRKEIVIHTGNWGCGAFGGNPTLTYLSQIIAANMTGVNKIVFHAPLKNEFELAKKLYEEYKENVVYSGGEKVIGKVCSIKQMIDFLLSYKFPWGSGNGS